MYTAYVLIVLKAIGGLPQVCFALLSLFTIVGLHALVANNFQITATTTQCTRGTRQVH